MGRLTDGVGHGISAQDAKALRGQKRKHGAEKRGMGMGRYSPGGVKELAVISAPIILSQASESIMMLTDRYFLTALGKEYPAASMSGGFTAFMTVIFFMGLLTYMTPLVAQYLGAGQKAHCSLVVAQGLFLSLLLYPLIAVLGYFGAPLYFEMIGTPARERELAIEYFNLINFGVFFLLIDTAFAGFFSGIGRTRVVMWVNVAMMAVNAPLAYFFIHYGVAGHFSGIAGAALGTTLSKAFAACIYLYLYTRPALRQEFSLAASLRFDRGIFKKMITFGAPTGMEFFLLFFAFNTFLALFHSYGSDEALAMTIIFNWDILAMTPIWGLNVGVMSLVGRYMGAGQVDLALKTTYSGLKIAMSITLVFSLLFWLYTEQLIMAFMPEDSKQAGNAVLPLATFMLKSVCLYMFANALNMVFTATLRAAGDTKWCMWGSIVGQWSMLALSFLAIKVWVLRPQNSWLIFVTTVLAMSLVFTLRFFHGRWKSIVMVEAETHQPAVDLPAA